MDVVSKATLTAQLNNITRKIRSRFPAQPEVHAVCLYLLTAFRNGEDKLPIWIKIRKFLQNEPDLLEEVEIFLDSRREGETPVQIDPFVVATVTPVPSSPPIPIPIPILAEQPITFPSGKL
ncbi:hypothetical protein BT69DRAFT_1352600 [Atractiella rhizophila]|nr:hypothetical protein BT69DRAFT_1352600 [Atractiella rhizophila]